MIRRLRSPLALVEVRCIRHKAKVRARVMDAATATVHKKLKHTIRDRDKERHMANLDKLDPNPKPPVVVRKEAPKAVVNTVRARAHPRPLELYPYLYLSWSNQPRNLKSGLKASSNVRRWLALLAHRHSRDRTRLMRRLVMQI